MYPVPKSEEWQRINALPRRKFTSKHARDLVESWSPRLLNDKGFDHWARLSRTDTEHRERQLESLAKQGTPIRMKPEQAIILYDFIQCRGVHVAGPVGVGKTFIGFMAPRLSEEYFHTKRPLLLVPASLVRDARASHLKLSQVWKQAENPVKIESYNMLGRPDNEFALCDCVKCTGGSIPEKGSGIRPDMIVLDESSRLRNPDSAVSRRIERYIAYHLPVVVAMTGTPIRKSIKNFTRQMAWSLGPKKMPVPRNWKDQDDWCSALDEKPRDGQRRPPGALLEWAPPGLNGLEAARRGVQQRIADTPGSIVIDEMSCDQPIEIRVIETPDDPLLNDAFYKFRTTDETLDGWAMGDAFSVLRYGTELSCGFYSKWDPRPPEWYINARSAWKQHVKRRIDDSQRSGRPIDREGVVAKLDADTPVYLAWKQAKEDFGKPNSVAVQVSLSTLAYATKWINENGPALAWVQHSWVGETLSKMSGVPYFAGKGLDKEGRPIQKHPPSESAIVSTHANSYGLNLQAWNRNLVIGPEYSAEKWEQQIGRTHRYGQEHPVSYDVLVSCAENLQALAAAISEAHNAQQTFGLQQKLLHASWDWSQVSEEANEPRMIRDEGRKARWTRRKSNN